MARRRKNASFTLHQTYGSGNGDRALIQAFYAKLNALIPGSTPVPIPPESHVHPGHDAETQKYIFADYAVRKIAPIALRAMGLKVQGAALEQLEPITNEKTAAEAAAAADAAAAHAVHYARAAHDFAAADAAADAAKAAVSAAFYARAAYDHTAPRFAAAHAAASAAFAAELNPDATWAAVSEMLQAL